VLVLVRLKYSYLSNSGKIELLQPSRGDDPQDRASKVGQFCKSAEEAIPPLALALFLFPLTTKAHSVRTLCMTRTEYRSEMTTLVQMGGCLLHTKVVLEATTIA
jgi:hypothetical protein